MKDQDDGVRELVLEQEKRVFNHCFTGAVDLVSVSQRRHPSLCGCVTAGLPLSLCRRHRGRVAGRKGEGEKSARGPDAGDRPHERGFRAARERSV